ncbi:MAG: ComF family protein [Vicinamibacterales bacterium]
MSRLRAAGAYEGVLRDAIHALKYDGRRSLAAPLGVLMRDAAGDLLDGASAVVPVPLHGARRRQRGFNQARLLARGLGLPVWPLLRRVRNTTPQAGLTRARRHGNVRHAFAVARRFVWQAYAIRHWTEAPAATGRILVLVDDVTTTGATLEACARVLRDAGAREVRALTVARAVSRTR